MGRPLRSDYLQKMNLEASITSGSKLLAKQVGYNKYVGVSDFAVAEDKKVYTLVYHNETLADGEARLMLKDGDTLKPVIKITKRLFYTADEVYSYELVDGVLTFHKSGVSVPAVDAANDAEESASDEEENEEESEGGEEGEE